MTTLFTGYLRCWMDLIARANPAAIAQFDTAGFELALIDLAADEESVDQSPAKLAHLADGLLHLSESLLRDVQRELEGDPRVGEIGATMGRLFLRGSGSSATDPELRRARKEACASVIALLESHFARILKRRKHALRMRRRRHEREEIRDAALFDPEARDTDPVDLAIMREGCARAVHAVRQQLSPEVFAFLRASLTQTGFVASHVARAFGTSPAALTRARARLAIALRREFHDLSRSASNQIDAFLVEAFHHAA